MRKRVLLLTPYLDHGIVQGITKFAMQAHWALDARIRRQWVIPEDWQGEGIITGGYRSQPGLMEYLDKYPMVPCVSVDHDAPPHGHRVLQDSMEAGRLACQHLRHQGYKQFAFVSTGVDDYSRERQEAFLQTAAELQLPCESLHMSERTLNRGHMPKAIVDFLRSRLAEGPLGIMTAKDESAAPFIAMCLQHGFKIPEDLGILGVDNDPLHCQLSVIRCTSIDNNRELHGYTCAESLQRLMEGHDVPDKPDTVPVAGVVVRESTQLNGEWPTIIKDLVALIDTSWQHAHFKAQDCATSLNISRRRLHELALAHLGESVATSILKKRLEHAHDLLKGEQALTMRHIASQSGFSSPEYMTRVFRRECGYAPSSLKNDT